MRIALRRGMWPTFSRALHGRAQQANPLRRSKFKCRRANPEERGSRYDETCGLHCRWRYSGGRSKPRPYEGKFRCRHKLQAPRIFGRGFGCARFLGAYEILAILGRTEPPDVAKDLRKVLLSSEAAGYGHVQYSRVGSTEHRFGALDSLAENELMRGLAR